MTALTVEVAKDGRSGKAVLECVEDLLGLQSPVEGSGHLLHNRGVRGAATVLNPHMKWW